MNRETLRLDGSDERKGRKTEGSLWGARDSRAGSNMGRKLPIMPDAGKNVLEIHDVYTRLIK